MALSGAVRHRGPAGEGYLALAVTDTGIGIDEKDHHLIFESFQQAGRGIDPTVRRYRSRAGDQP